MTNPISAYVKRYANTAAADAWLSEHLLSAEKPPVSFLIDGVPSHALSYTKTVGEAQRVTDFEEDAPFVREVRTVTYACTEKKLTLSFTVTTYEGYPVVEYDGMLTYEGKGLSGEISHLMAADSVVEEADAPHVLHASKGSTYSYTEFMPFRYTFANGDVHLSCTCGKCTREFIPYFNIASPRTNTGTVAILNWQGTWDAAFSEGEDGVRFAAGQSETDFVLREGEQVRIPGVVLLFYRGDWICGQNVYRRWIYQCNIFRYQHKHMKSTNVLMGSPNTDEAGDLASIEMYRRTGLLELFDKFNIDAGTEDHGWYPTDGFAWSRTGNWYVDRKYYPGGLHPISDAIHEAGLQFALWFEPERVLTGTKTARDINSHIIAIRDDGSACHPDDLTDNRDCLVNYAHKEAVDYITDLLDRSFTEYGVDQYRQDFNFSPAPYWTAYDRTEEKTLGIPRRGLCENFYCTGYLALWTELIRRHPGMYFDACASGGQRYDLETMRYSFLHTRSDYWADIESAQAQTYGSSFWFLYWGTGFTDLTDYDVRSHMGNSIGVGISRDEDAPRLRHALEEWKDIAAYTFGDYYPLTPYAGQGEGTMSLQYDLPEEGKGMIMTFFRRGDAITVSPRGLDPDAEYRIWNRDGRIETEQVLSGAALMAGFSIAGEAKTAVVYEYEAVSPDASLAFLQTEVPFGPGAVDEGVCTVSDAYTLSACDIPTPNTRYRSTALTDAELQKAYHVTEDDTLVHVGYDYMGTGTIYAISRNIYRGLRLTGGVLPSGWKGVDRGSMELQLGDTFHSFRTWDGGYFYQQPYVKEISGTYFMWFVNTIPLGDADGGWKSEARVIRWTDTVGEMHTSRPFVYTVDAEPVERIRATGQETASPTDAIYAVDENLFDAFVYTGRAMQWNHMTWYEVDPDTTGYILRWQKCPDECRSIEEQTVYSGDSGVFKLYAACDGDGWYLYIKDMDAVMDTKHRLALTFRDKEGNTQVHSFRTV